MTTDYSSAIDAVFGPQEEPAGAPSHNAPADAVDTSGGITAALDASPGVTEQRARETLTPAPEQKPEEFPWSNPAAAWYTPPEEKPAQEFSTGTLRLQMAGREVLRHELLPEGKTDDGTGALLRASFALNAASQYSRDDAFTAATASAALGMPLGMTLDNLDKARDMLGEYTPAKVKDFAPGFLRLVQYDYDSAILWRHDLATANAVSKAFDNAGEGLAGLSGGLALAGRVKNPVELDPESRAAALDRGVNYAALSLAQMGFNLGKLALEGFGALARGVDENYQPEDLAGKPVATAILEASDTMGEWVKNLSGVREKIGLGSPLYGLSVWDNPDVLLDSRWWLENTPGAVASMLPILGAYAKGGAAAAGLTGLVMNGNEVYTDLLDAGMEDNSRTRLYSLLGGAAMSTLDVVGLSGIFGGKVAVKKAAKEAILQAAKGGIKAAAYVSKRAGQAYLFEGGTEWLQNLVKAGVEGAAKGKDFGGILSDIGEAAKQLEDFILGGLMGGGIGGVHAHGQVGGERARQRLVDSITRAAASEGVVAARAEVESVVQDNAEAQQRMTFAQSLTQMAEAADGSTMRAADPAIFEREADKLIPEGARAVWLDVDMVREFIEADGARLEALGLTAREVAEALQVQAGAVKVSTARLMSRFEGDDRALLLQNARMTPGGMTLTEAQEFDPQKRAEAAAERIRARNSVNAETGRERTRLKNEFVQAGYAPHVAEYYATLHAEQARTFADRYGMDPVMMLKERSVVRGEPDNIGDNALYHPMNPGTDLDAPVSVVAVQPRFVGKKLWELMKGKGRSALCDAVVGVYTNRNTGWVIKVTGYGADHAINSATRRGVGGIEHMEAVVNLPSLIESAVLVESHKDKKNQGLAAVHRMYAPMLLGKDMYAVKLTVKESPEGMVAAIEDVRKLYDVSLEKKMPGDLFAPPPDAKETLTGSATPTPGISEISLRSLLEDVNDSEGNRFFQPMNPGTDLDAPVTVVTVRPRFVGEKLWELMKGNDKVALRKEIVGAYVNADTGWRISLTGSGVDHAVSSAKKSMNGIAHMEAVANLPALIEKAALVESHKDKKGQRLAAVHRMYAPMFLDGNMYAIKLTVKESQAGMVAEIVDIRRLYDVSLEKKMPGDPRQPPDLAETSGKTGSTPGISEISLRSLLEDVNDSEGNRFFQPMNPGTDLDAPVTVVTVRPRFVGEKLWELMKGNDKVALRKEIVGAYVNADTGWRISLTGSGVDHAVSSAKKSMNGIAHMEAVAGLPRLIESAMLVESHADRKGQGLKAIHRMYAPMQVGNDVYAVKLTVKELDIGRVAEIEDVRKLYDLILEKKMPGDLRQGPGIAQNATGKLGSTPGISKISLRSLLEDVNDSEGNRFFQAMNPGADLDAPVTVVAVRPRFVGQNPKVLRKRFPDEVRRAVLDAFKAGVVNEDTGLRVNMSASDFKEHLKFDDGDVVDGLAQLEAIAALPGLMREAKLVESYDDKKGADGIQKMHRFQAALRIGGKDYSVKMTVKEYKDGFLEIDASTPLKLYHHRLEKEMPAGNSASLSHGDPSPRPSAGIHEYTLRSLLEDVNDSEGRRFFQPPLRAEEPTRKAHSLPQRFAALPVVEADSSQWFGKGKEIEADKKNLRKNLKEWAKENFSRDTAASNADTGWEVQVTAKGVKNSLAHGFNATLARSVPFIPQIIEGGIHVDSIRKTPRLMSHIFANKIKLDGQDYVVGFVVREDANGNRFYDHELTEIIDPGLHNHAELPEGMGGQWERANRGDVMNILREKLGVNDGSGRILFQAADADPANARGAASFGPDGRSVTSIFKDASDLSTPIHEGAHVFINDLIRVVMDGGRMAEQLYAREITVVNKDTSIDDSLRQRRQRALRRRWNKHKTGLWQAREDLAALVENANAQREAHGKAIGVDLPSVTLEEALQGQLTQEQVRTLQEVNAAGFEAYMREGKAPSSKLAAVFHKMRQWLASIYRLAVVHGVKVTPEVRRVFDRMLATDEALRKSQAGAALADEGAFLSAVQEAETGLAPDESGEWTLTDRINDMAALNQDSEYERLQELYDRAEAEVTARMDKATLQDRNKRWKAYFDEGKEIARGDVFYEIMAALSVKEGNPYSGISRDWLERRYGKAAVADFLKTAQGRRLISKDGGVALDAVGIGDIVGGIERADALGLTDADGLYNYLYDNVVVRRRNMVNDARAYADQRMADDDARAEAGGDEPGEAYRNYLEEVEAAVLRLAARQDSGWRTKEQQARWVEEHRTPLAEVRRRVKSVLRGKKLRDIQPNQFVGEVRKALQERNASLAAGNAPDALAAVDRARTALESWIEANRIVKERQAFEKQAARLAALKRDVVLPEAWTAIQDVLERFRLVPPRGRMEGESATLSETVLFLCEDAAEINGLPAIAEWLLDENARANYRDLTPERIQDVKDVLSMLEHMGRQGLAANRESEAAEIQDVAEGGAEAMSGLKELSVAREGTAWHRWQGWMRSFFGNMISSLQWKFRQADGFSNLGPDGRRGINEDRLWGGIVDGEARYQVRMSGLKERLDPIFRRLVESATSWEAKLGKTFAVNGKPLPVPEIMRGGGKLNWTSDRVLALVLNLGNEGNVQRLREGYPDLSPEALSHLIGDDATRLVFPDWQGRGNDGLLSARDWRDVQEIGNVLHSQWADIQATHKRLFGFAPRGVDARPLTVRVGGQSVNLAGWYYPAVYDAALSPEVRKRQEQQDAIVRTEAVCAAPAAKRGFTKARANSGGGAPLLLETGVVMSHLNDVCRFIEMAEIARFADRVTRAPQWAQAYIRAFGRQDYEAIRPNLKGLVLEERPPSDTVSKSADWLRERLVPWGLAFNLKTALLQSTAVFPAMNDLGASNTMRGISAVAKGGYALIKEIREISPYMKSRAANIDQDLRKAMRDIDARTRQNVVKLLGKELTWDDVVEAGMLPLISVDMATSSAIWMAAYNKEAAVLMNSPAGKPGIDPSSEHHTAAARAADMAVKAVNPDFNPSSRSQFLRSRGMTRFLNIFSSAVVLFAQRRAYNAGALRQAWGKAPSAGGKMRAALRYARHEMYDFALQGAAMGVILSLAYGEDDPKKWGKNMAGAWLDAAAMRVPVFGSPVTALITGETWRGISMVYDQPWQMAKRASGALHKGSGNGLALSLADIISFELKVPASRLGRNAVRGYEQWQKGEGTPLSPLMPRPNSY